MALVSVPYYEIKSMRDQIVWLRNELSWFHKENARLRKENESYALWMNLSIDRIKEMQQ